MGDLTDALRDEIRLLREQVDGLLAVHFGVPLELQWNGYQPCVTLLTEAAASSLYLKIGTRSGTHYAHQQVAYDDVAGVWNVVAGGVSGTVSPNVNAAVELGLSTSVPSGTVVAAWPNAAGTGYLFDSGGGGGGFFARITGNAGKRYSFVQVAVRAENPPGTITDDVIDVPGGVVGTTTVGWAYDIGGGSAALHTPAPALTVLMTPNPLVAGTWLFGPVTVC